MEKVYPFSKRGDSLIVTGEKASFTFSSGLGLAVVLWFLRKENAEY